MPKTSKKAQSRRSTTKGKPVARVGFIESMECLSVTKLPDGQQWSYEIKLDGFRLEAVKEASEPTLYSRRGSKLPLGGAADPLFTRSTFSFKDARPRRRGGETVRVRAGFVPATRREVFAQIKHLKVAKCQFANLPEANPGRWGQGLTAEKMKGCVWLEPEAVARVDFAEWTAGINCAIPDLLHSAMTKTLIRL